MTLYNGLALILFGIRAVKVETDPAISPPYTLNLRIPPTGRVTEDVLRAVAGYLYGLARAMELAYDGICGVPSQGDPFVSALGRKTQAPQIWLEVEEREGAEPAIVLGVFKIVLAEMGLAGDSRIMLISDVLSNGATERQTAELLRNQGLVVEDILVVVDREEGGKESLQENGITVHALLTTTQIMTDLYESGRRVSALQRQRVAEYIQANRQRAETA